MPFLQKEGFVFKDRHFNATYLGRLDAIHSGQPHG
jgi:hypothetical protein